MSEKPKGDYEFSSISKAPEGYNGMHLSIDEMNPEFNPDGTVIITTEHLANLVSIGSIVLLGSNLDPDREGFAKVLEVDKHANKIKLQIID